MIRLLLAVALAAASLAAVAGAKPGAAEDHTGIVTPDIAVGMSRWNEFNYDTNGNMVVCRSDDVSRGDCSKWRPVQSVVPNGRLYVGFRVVSSSYGYRQLEVYWK